MFLPLFDNFNLAARYLYYFFLFILLNLICHTPSGAQVHYLSNINNDGRDDYCESLGWKRLQEYRPDQRRWKYLNDLVEGNAVLEDDLPFGDEEEEEEDYYPSLPFAALYSCFKVLLVRHTLLIWYD